MSTPAKDDISLASTVSAGEARSCKFFVDEYTDLVLSKGWNLSKTNCRYPTRGKICSLIILQKQRKGVPFFSEDQRDDCSCLQRIYLVSANK